MKKHHAALIALGWMFVAGSTVLKAEPADTPDISVTPDSLAADLLTGQSAVQYLTIANTGTGDLNFTISVEESAVPVAVRFGDGSSKTDHIPLRAAGPTVPDSSQTAGPPQPFEVGPPREAINSIFLADNFEDGNYDGWSIGGTYSTKEVTNATAANGTTFSYHEYGSYVTTHFMGIYQNLGPIQPGYIRFWIRSGSTTTHDAYFVLRDSGGNEAIWFLAAATGYLYINADVGGDFSYPYTALTWYKIEYKNIDWTAKNFDYYVNGALVKETVSQLHF